MQKTKHKKEYPPGQVYEAQELYCVVRLTYEEAAAQTGIAVSTLKRWGKKYEWASKRDALARAEADIKADTILARAKLLKDLLNTGEAQTAFAVSALEKVALEQKKAAQAQAVSEKVRARAKGLEPAQVASALREALETRLAVLLDQPEKIDLATLKGLKDAFDFLAAFAGKSEAQEEPRNKAISADLAALIQEHM